MLLLGMNAAGNALGLYHGVAVFDEATHVVGTFLVSPVS